MKTKTTRHLSMLGLAFLLTAAAVPSLGHASEPVPANTCPTVSLIELSVDPITGGIFMRDAAGGWQMAGSPIVVEVGDVESVTLDIVFAFPEWEVEITPDEEDPDTVFTVDGELEYEMDAHFTDFNIHATNVDDASLSMDFLVRLDTDCS